MRRTFEEAVKLLDNAPEFDGIPIADGAGNPDWEPSPEQADALKAKGYSLRCLDTFKGDNIWHIVRS